MGRNAQTIMTRRIYTPDTRPRWDDEDLTVRYNGRDYSAEEYKTLCALTLLFDRSPHYTKDPSYNWNRKKENLK